VSHCLFAKHERNTVLFCNLRPDKRPTLLRKLAEARGKYRWATTAASLSNASRQRNSHASIWLPGSFKSRKHVNQANSRYKSNCHSCSVELRTQLEAAEGVFRGRVWSIAGEHVRRYRKLQRSEQTFTAQNASHQRRTFPPYLSRPDRDIVFKQAEPIAHPTHKCHFCTSTLSD